MYRVSRVPCPLAVEDDQHEVGVDLVAAVSVAACSNDVAVAQFLALAPFISACLPSSV